MAFWDNEIITEAEEAKAFELIPAGKYEAKLVNAEVKTTKNGMGYYLNTDFEITGPTRIGARVFQMITIHNSNRTAVTIGMGQLHQLAVAGGAEKWWESTKTVGSLEQAIAHCNTIHTALAGQKIGINVGIDVGRNKDDGSKYDDKNKINSFVKLAGTGTAPDMVVEDPDDIPFNSGSTDKSGGLSLATKVCFKCGVSQPRSNFYAHPQMRDGLLGKCKTCSKKDVSKNYRSNIDHYVEYERARFQQPKRKADALRHQRTRRENHPDKYQAHSLVNNSLKRQGIAKLPCEVCGSTDSQAHHHDYSAPLDVQWLCRKHHLELHGKQSYAA